MEGHDKNSIQIERKEIMGANATRKPSRKREAVIAIIGRSKNSWYKDMLGNTMRVMLFRDDGRALSISIKDWIEPEHFKVVKGKDIRRIDLRKKP
jgi:hypothetical protein